MINYAYKSTTDAGRVCLEISLKPFGIEKSEKHYEDVARALFEQWKPLLRYATGCSVLIWTSDGSEIFEYTGDLNRDFEWCKYIGIGNWDRNADLAERQSKPSLHSFPILYRENPPKFTYRDLKEIISILKKVGRAITGMEIEIGETFDPGPEFAYSEFKYEKHPEIAPGDLMGKKRWLHCAARLHADPNAYAAYPDGIPEGTHVGEYLGKQFMAMKKDLGFDYLWLSNGFGFSLASWDWLGETFDGKTFNADGGERVRRNILEFWKYFTAEIGDTRIEVRGSNLSAGMDIAAHGCPLADIYRTKNTVSPPNSPWAPLDYRFGLELSGFMSHIAELPDRGFLFRYYIHDPWWMNSPWFDRYDRSPHDIYLPLAIARLDGNAEVTKPFGVSFLSADDSFGRLPDRCPNEVIPHLLTAYNDYSDEPGLLTWVYPFETYNDPLYQKIHNPAILMGDWFIESAIDAGLPINTVISDRNFRTADAKRFAKSLLLIPVPRPGSADEDALTDALDAGCRVILYGSLRGASEALKKRIGVTYREEISGELTVENQMILDHAETDTYSDRMIHEPLFSDGGIGEVSDGSGRVLTAVRRNGEERAYAVLNAENNVVWIRGSFPHQSTGQELLPPLRKPSECFVPSILTRGAMRYFGYPLSYDLYSVDDKVPITMFSRCRDALFLTLFAKDASVKMRLSTPWGVPAFDNSEFILEDNVGSFSVSRWIHTDCRVFIKQNNRSKISVKKEAVGTQVDCDERIIVQGLSDATVGIYPGKGGIAWLGCGYEPEKTEKNVKDDDENGCFSAEHLSGSISIQWQAKENCGDYRKLEFLRTQQDEI